MQVCRYVGMYVLTALVKELWVFFVMIKEDSSL